MNRISGSVYIWYPKDRNVGHCSLQIGENNSPENYVSWWPDGTAKFSGRNNVLTSFVLHNDEIKQAPYVLIPKEYDIQAENEQPHVTYHLHPDCFDLVKIQAAWQRIKTKSNPHYRMIGKNCADIVGRILTEGASAPCRRYVEKIQGLDYLRHQEILPLCSINWQERETWRKLYRHHAQREVVALYMYA